MLYVWSAYVIYYHVIHKQFMEFYIHDRILSHHICTESYSYLIIAILNNYRHHEQETSEWEESVQIILKVIVMDLRLA